MYQGRNGLETDIIFFSIFYLFYFLSTFIFVIIIEFDCLYPAGWVGCGLLDKIVNFRILNC